MKFEKIPKKHFRDWGCIRNAENFTKFREKFDVIGVNWTGGMPFISASYFLNLLQNGGSVKPPYSSYYSYLDYEHQKRVFHNFENRLKLFDHTAIWRTEDNKVFLTSMPYSDKELCNDLFQKLADEFLFPETIKLKFLPDEYRFRSNGALMLAIYDENAITM